MAGQVILCVNSGSSSLKLALYEIGDGGEERRLGRGAVERIGLDGGRLWLQATGAADLERPGQFADHRAAVAAAFEALDQAALPAPDAVGHRVVHGGPDHVAPEPVTPALLDSLRALVPYAPLHMPSEILAIKAVSARFPGLLQVACFDTAFHRRMPALAQRLPLPGELWDLGVRRYGFHGLSYEYVVSALGAAASGRVIIAHLGNGASLAAVRDGQPVDTTMGFTPTGGLMMGTRTGDLDPGVLLHLLTAHGFDAARLDELVNRRSGLLGVSGHSSDMRTLLELRAGQDDVARAAAEAVDLFCYIARKHIGALAAALTGLDLLVFTGGIGERAAAVRAQICDGLGHLGVRLLPAANEVHASVVSAPGSACAVRVVKTEEDLVIARHTRRLLVARSAPAA